MNKNKKKKKKYNKIERVADSKNKPVFATEDSAAGMNEIGKGNSEKQTSSYKINESWGWNVQCGGIVNNNVISLYSKEGSQNVKTSSCKINDIINTAMHYTWTWLRQ